MFENFPKKRIELPEKFVIIYKKQYKSNREGKSKASWLSQKMEAWLHKKIASDVKRFHNKKTLEIGAGTLNQLKYENPNFYDIVEPFKELFLNSPCINRINKIYDNIDEVELSQKYNRITSVATFEHILDLPKVIAKTCILLDKTGSLRTSIPNEGTFLWTMGWKITTGLEFKFKYGLDYGILMKYEHVNTADEIEEILNYFYNINKCKVFGLNKRIALYRFYESKEPRIELAQEYLKTLVNKQVIV